MTMTVKEMTDDVCEKLNTLIKTSRQVYLHRNVFLRDIPNEDIDVLCMYLPLSVITTLFGGDPSNLRRDFNRRIKARNEKKRAGDKTGNDIYEPFEPSGVGGWQYFDRIKQKVIRKLEEAINTGVTTGSGHSQTVAASRTLLDEAAKGKDDAIEVMKAYQDQLIIVAEHLVERFLPALGMKIKQDLRKDQDAAIEDIKKLFSLDPEESEINNAAIEEWRKTINRFVRLFELKRFELMLAETMVENKEVATAFDFSHDLIQTYRETDLIGRDSGSVTKLKEHIQRREREKNIHE